MVTSGLGSVYCTFTGGGVYTGGGGSAFGASSINDTSMGGACSMRCLRFCICMNANATARCSANVIPRNTARPEKCGRNGRRAFSSRSEPRQGLTAVNRGIGHVVENLDGHGCRRM